MSKLKNLPPPEPELDVVVYDIPSDLREETLTPRVITPWEKDIFSPFLSTYGNGRQSFLFRKVTQSEYDHAVGIHATFDGTRFFASAYVVAPGRPRIHLVTTTPLRSTTPWDIENEVVQLANEIFGSLARLNQE